MISAYVVHTGQIGRENWSSRQLTKVKVCSCFLPLDIWDFMGNEGLGRLDLVSHHAGPTALHVASNNTINVRPISY